MIFPYKITIEDLSKAGKNYNWPIHRCERCQRNMWGHGYVARYFTSHLNEVYVKRYRCPTCNSVATARPEDYWPNIRSSIRIIYEALRAKLSSGQWPSSFPRQRGGHWIARFVRFTQMEMITNILSFLDYCYQKQIHFLA